MTAGRRTHAPMIAAMLALSAAPALAAGPERLAQLRTEDPGAPGLDAQRRDYDARQQRLRDDMRGRLNDAARDRRDDAFQSRRNDLNQRLQRQQDRSRSGFDTRFGR